MAFADAPGAVAADTQPPKVLVVDDNEDASMEFA
jgi:hypothetical protein